MNDRSEPAKPITINECQICGEKASLSFFGVVSCHPCRMFFKRYAENQHKLTPCTQNGKCIVKGGSRRACPTCRLKKCFDIGMQVHRIRHSSTVKGSTKQIQNALQKLPTINLLQTDQSALNAEQWTLLTNLINLYDARKLFSLTEQLNLHGHLQGIDLSLAQQFLDISYETAARSFRLNHDIHTRLSFNDRSLLLSTALDNINCLTATYIFSESHLDQNIPYINFIETRYGTSLVNRYCWHSTFAQSDVLLFKLILAVYTFSTSSRVFYPKLQGEFEDPRKLVEIESEYAEAIWKYLLYRYPCGDAIRRYLQLIRWLLATTMLSYDCYHATTHVNNMEKLIEDTEMTLILDDADRVMQADEIISPGNE